MAKKNLPKKQNPKFPYTDLRNVALFLFFTLLFLFYPGDSYYVELFFSHRDLFAHEQSKPAYQMPSDIPYVINKSVQPDISALGVYIIDLDSATPVFARAEHERFLPASTTKIITALVAYDTFAPEDVLEVKKVIDEGQVVGLVAGEKLTFENLLYATLVHSGNDAAYVIADNFPAGREAFVSAMNQKAAELGMRDSQFQNPAGFDAFRQYTTPFDLSLAARALLQNSLLSKIVSTKAITISDVDFNYFHKLNNVNQLLGEIPGVGGLKTGFTQNAGENLVTFYKSNGHRFLMVIVHSEDRFEDTRAIVSWINTNIAFTESPPLE